MNQRRLPPVDGSHVRATRKMELRYGWGRSPIYDHLTRMACSLPMTHWQVENMDGRVSVQIEDGIRQPRIFGDMPDEWYYLIRHPHVQD